MFNLPKDARILLPIGLILFCFFSVSVAIGVPKAEKIINGTRASVSDYPPVARLLDSGSTLCSGTLIAPQYVLTAAHCFFDERGNQVLGGGDITVELAGVEYATSEVTIHPTYIAGDSACVEGETDSAVIKLQQVVSIAPIDIQRSTLATGVSLLLAGYGLEGSGESGQTDREPPDGKVNIGFTRLDGYGSGGGDNSNSDYFYWSFNRSDGGSNTASGDSGGPAFYSDDGTLFLAGTTCGGTGDAGFGTESYDIRTDRISGWVDSITGGGVVVTPEILGSKALSGKVGVAFNHKLYASGGGEISFASSDLPAGLSLNGSVLSGTPAVFGSSSFNVVASNSAGSRSHTFTLSTSGFIPSMSVRTARVRVRSENSSSVRVQGRIAVGSRFKPSRKRAIVTIGSFSKSFLLGQDGASISRGANLFSLAGDPVSGVFRRRSPTFNLQLSSAALGSALQQIGFKSSEDASAGEIVVLPLRITIAGVPTDGSKTLTFSEGEGAYR